jgi:hypothetical protein
MNVELEHYNKSNSKLDLHITDLKQKLKAAEREVDKEKEKWKMLSASIWKFKVDLLETAQHIQDPKLLKVNIMRD